MTYDKLQQGITISVAFLIVAVGSLALPPTAYAQDNPENFDGFKIGVSAGWESRSIDEIVLPDPSDFRLNEQVDDFAIGGYVSYDKQINRFVLGAEAEFQLDGRTISAAIPEIGTVEVSSDWSANFSARAGVAATDRLLVYGRLGYRLNSYKAEVTPTGANAPSITENSSLDGLLYGVGVEYAASDRFSVRAEYRETDFSILLESQQLLFGAAVRF